MTYAQAPTTMSYAAPITMSYAAPTTMSYAAPTTMSYAAPTTTMAAPATYAAPMSTSFVASPTVQTRGFSSAFSKPSAPATTVVQQPTSQVINFADIPQYNLTPGATIGAVQPGSLPAAQTTKPTQPPPNMKKPATKKTRKKGCCQ